MIREDIDHFFMKIAFMYASRSTCFRRQVGSVIARDKIQLSAGYNGALPGMEHCIDNHDLCIREKLNIPSGERQELCRSQHAEANAISKAAMNGINIKDATLYVTCKPCTNCTKMIISSGIKRLVYCGDYSSGIDDELTNSLIVNIQVDRLDSKDFEEFIKFNNCIRDGRC